MYNSKGAVIEKHLYKYDSKGRKSEKYIYNSRGALHEKELYKNHMEQNKIQCI